MEFDKFFLNNLFESS